jgi:hypothetical protein
MKVNASKKRGCPVKGILAMLAGGLKQEADKNRVLITKTMALSKLWYQASSLGILEDSNDAFGDTNPARGMGPNGPAQKERGLGMWSG